jgi:hypothetical protein
MTIAERIYIQHRQRIIKVLAYFDIFNYPLTTEEIELFLDQSLPADIITTALQQLTAAQQVFKLGHFYSLQNNMALRDRRIAGNNNAAAIMTTAYKIGAFLYRFPFVRGIGISGSLSKNYADEHTDIDFFIITKSNRLWIARTLMHLFKKLTFLTGDQDLYCMNYYIDEDALNIEEHNIFTATEMVTLVPVCGKGAMDDFFTINNWTATFFPNQPAEKRVHSIVRNGWLKRSVEWLLSTRPGNALDNYCMRVTTNRWLQKEQQYRVNAHGDRLAMCTGKHFSKPNPIYFQRKVLEAFDQKCKQSGIFEERPEGAIRSL